MSNSGWIGVDLDGTLAHYDGWRGPEHIGPPVTPMLERVKAWLAEGLEVKIFTARVSGLHSRRPEILEAAAYQAGRIQGWLVENGLPRLDVTATKDFNMVELWDDRAIQVRKNTGEPVT